MQGEILAIGTELLMGQIANTNAQYISEKLPSADIYVFYHTVVGDNKERIKACLKHALNRVDVVIITGGLGPTQDDITKETVAEFFDKKMILDKESIGYMKEFFNKLGRTMTKNNERQAYFPENSIIVKNPMGTAPGCIIESNGKTVVMMPGPPREMKPMLDESIIPFFLKNAESKLYTKYLKIFGIGESSMEDRIKDIISKQSNPTIAPYAKLGEAMLRVTAKYNAAIEDENEIMQPTLKSIKDRIGEFIYSEENKEMNQVVCEMLIENDKTISFAESCTGGLLSNLITDVPGASKCFLASFITYSNASKVNMLNVNMKTIEEHGAVSEECAYEMVKGLKAVTKSDYAISITGIAGPDGGTKEKPVGLVYIGFASKEKIRVIKLNLWGTRDRIKRLTCLNALNILRLEILEETN